MLTAATGTTRTWLDRYYEQVDAMKLDELVEFFAPDARLTFANWEPVAGRAAIRDAIGGIFGAIAGIGHRIRNLCEGPDGLVVFEVDVTYTRTDGRDVTVPGAAVCTVADELFTEQRIYVDLTPVFA